MKGVKVSLDRIVVDFTSVGWDYFNYFHNRFCRQYGVRMTVRDKGFKYHITARDEGHYIHVSYLLLFKDSSKRYTLRIECHPESLIHFQVWLREIRQYAEAIYFVRCDVAFDIPISLTELFTLSLTGRKFTPKLGTRYYNQKKHRQKDGYCRVYDKKAELLACHGVEIEGKLTRMEIVYAPKEKIPLDILVQHPPKFNSRYLCAHLTSPEKLKPKLLHMVQGMMSGTLKQQDVSYYYRKKIENEVRKQPVLDFDAVAAEQWEEVVTIPCAVLGGMVNKVPLAQ